MHCQKGAVTGVGAFIIMVWNQIVTLYADCARAVIAIGEHVGDDAGLDRNEQQNTRGFHYNIFYL